jgi:quercetin dioxygenase-like cupin family protein
MTIATTTTGAYHLAAGEGPALWHLGGLLTFKATSEATGGGLWVQEARGARGYASPMHSHAREDEAFYVLDGEITVYVGDETITATPGSFLWAPRDVPHAYCVESEEARFLALSTGSGFDRFFFATGEPAGALTLPPPPEGPPDIPALVAASAEHGVHLVGPPPAPRS